MVPASLNKSCASSMSQSQPVTNSKYSLKFSLQCLYPYFSPSLWSLSSLQQPTPNSYLEGDVATRLDNNLICTVNMKHSYYIIDSHKKSCSCKQIKWPHSSITCRSNYINTTLKHDGETEAAQLMTFTERPTFPPTQRGPSLEPGMWYEEFGSRQLSMTVKRKSLRTWWTKFRRQIQQRQKIK